MALLSSRTVALVRSRVSEMLTDTCTLQRRIAAVGTMGEPKQQYVDVSVDVACRVIRAGRTETTGTTQTVGGAVGLKETFRLICPVGTPFLTHDRVVMSDGSVYQVVSVTAKLTDSADAQAIIERVL